MKSPHVKKGVHTFNKHRLPTFMRKKEASRLCQSCQKCIISPSTKKYIVQLCFICKITDATAIPLSSVNFN
ncbi:hypothetical protein HMPREF0492_1635 [Lactobacillus acidophilus ATCC 4796]|uniref:Uncharacterized protein n=1 Tax=Lactobacillus acidophilus (strain ATCC 700396 / NCK56 / N2 / NCFM) TaxID=272621 RepID=Q5FJP0_LACAC|nr:hypothetical protein LBA1251 [Lactobacillus acidophilus NCFM]AGK94423.1 hypothetical protein LA14_1255 [Lactobacillus acidophilus La-14]AJP46604.1 hypothetical protein SD55_1247 [Lactobacillus acidophilus]EEJ75611.1 hypothetical protein HMPREF0492_1635 [Lactobacillus acidophilus ATCC 4796]KRK29237.1 hypothetical protein FC29_GL000941 [Lactobacillus acidophilus DSM 20079 = JCM 1132 = NBRC 13951 = CIP 76.13]